VDLGYSNRVDPLPYITSDKEPVQQNNNIQNNTNNNNNSNNNVNNTNSDENKPKNTIPIQ